MDKIGKPCQNMPHTIAIREVTPHDWPNIEALFGARGACGGCWCMWWRVPHGGKLWDSVKGEKNRRSLRELVTTGQAHAMLAFEGERPVGWCCFGPRNTFPRLETVRALKREWQPDTWAIVCFYIHPRSRRRGVAAKLLAAATERALALGAREVEGYPVSRKDGTFSPAFAWTGVPALFDAAGYRLLPYLAGSRPIYTKRRD